MALLCFPTVSKAATQTPSESDREEVSLNKHWAYASYCASYEDSAYLYRAKKNRKDIVVAVDAGHGTIFPKGSKTYCHPDKTPKTTGGSTAKGALYVTSAGGGMTFKDGVSEAVATLQEAMILKEMLLDNGYDVLMIRETEKTRLDTITRALIANHYADCHISIHWDGDGLDYDKGAFYISVPDGIKDMYPTSMVWEKNDYLGECLVQGLEEAGTKIYSKRKMAVDLQQTSYSSIPSVDMELGNQCSDHSEKTLKLLAEGLYLGIDRYFFG